MRSWLWAGEVVLDMLDRGKDGKDFGILLARRKMDMVVEWFQSHEA